MPSEGVGPEKSFKTHNIQYRIQNTDYRIQIIEYRIHNIETYAHKITNVPVFIWRYENLDFFGPKWHSLRWLPFQGPKKSRFLGPPLPMALEIDSAQTQTF